ncbi:MAG: hypothetical protein PHV53_10675 [Fermentimonas sp.]|nr:hypothetical protein [Fermentimonas sp.]
MIAVIKGDIVSSRKAGDPEKWLLPLKKLFSEWGETPVKWEFVWGDSFQLEIDYPEDALTKAFIIKALVKKIGKIDVRMTIGLGNKTYSGERISESNGEAFVFAGEKFEELEKEKSYLLIKSAWNDFDKEINLYLKLASVFMDNWTTASAELVELVLREPSLNQSEIGKRLGIKQNSVSGRWKRAHMDELLAVIRVYRYKLEKLQI